MTTWRWLAMAMIATGAQAEIAGPQLPPAQKTTAAQQAIARDIQSLAWAEVPFLPLGEYKQPTAYRKSVAGVLDGTAVFWNVRPA